MESETKEAAAGTPGRSWRNTRQPPPRRTTREFSPPLLHSSRTHSTDSPRTYGYSRSWSEFVKRSCIMRIVIVHTRHVVIGGGGDYYLKKLKMTKKEPENANFVPSYGT
jgi:hypothetical protein